MPSIGTVGLPGWPALLHRSSALADCARSVREPIAERLAERMLRGPETLLVPPGLSAVVTSALDRCSLLTPTRVDADDPAHADAWAALPREGEPDRGPLALYAARELVLRPGATLRVDGDPAIVAVERLTLVEGAAVEVLTRVRMFIGTLHKIDR